MEVREAVLPGIGHKFSLEIRGGAEVVVVVHTTGKREVFRFDPGRDDADAVLELSDEEAHRVGAILAGSYFEPVRADPMLRIMAGLHLRWVRVQPASPLVGRTLRQLEIRRRTGASVIAIAREGSHVPNPSPDEAFAAGDTVIVIGREDQVRQFEEILARS
ncbi:MAG: cation:proton antiporter regulatory subunit [Gemmatimonadota bacterium]